MSKGVMSNTSQVILVFLVILITWILTSFYQLHKAKRKPGILLSPDENKSIERVAGIGTEQLILHFYKLGGIGGSNITSFTSSGDTNDISLQYQWVDNHNVTIQYDSLVQFSSQKDKLYYFGDSVNIQYQLKY